jgi:hypothetical protein
LLDSRALIVGDITDNVVTPTSGCLRFIRHLRHGSPTKRAETPEELSQNFWEGDDLRWSIKSPARLRVLAAGTPSLLKYNP